MKFCFITSGVLSGHSTMKRALGMAPIIVSMGHEVSILIQEHQDNRTATKSLDGVGIYYFQTFSAYEERSFKINHLQTNFYDIVHCCGLGWRNYVRSTHVKCFTIIDHVELESTIGSLLSVRRIFQSFLEKKAISFFDGSVAASRYIEFYLRRAVFRKRRKHPVLWLPYASTHAFTKADASLVTKCKNITCDCTLVTYMGSHYKNYGCYELIYSLAQLIGNDSKICGVFLGLGPETAALKNLVVSLRLEHNVFFPGFVTQDQAIAYLHASSVLISPLNDSETDWARCPSKVYEYMAVGRPIVTCRIGENLEALGDEGVYYIPGDVSSMCKAILRALNLSKAPKYKNFTWDDRARQYLNWVTEVQSDYMRGMKLKSI